MASASGSFGFRVHIGGLGLGSVKLLQGLGLFWIVDTFALPKEPGLGLGFRLLSGGSQVHSKAQGWLGAGHLEGFHSQMPDSQAATPSDPNPKP